MIIKIMYLIRKSVMACLTMFVGHALIKTLGTTHDVHDNMIT
jgi:hypothetical protein